MILEHDAMSKSVSKVDGAVVGSYVKRPAAAVMDSAVERQLAVAYAPLRAATMRDECAA